MEVYSRGKSSTNAEFSVAMFHYQRSKFLWTWNEHPSGLILIVQKNKVNFGECNGSHRIQAHRGCMNSYLWNLWFFPGLFNGSMIVNEHPKLPGVWPVAVCGILYPNINSTAAPAPRFPRAPPICGCSLANNFHQKCRNPQDLYGNLVQNCLLPQSEWNPEIHWSFHQKRQTSHWSKRLCGVVSHEVQDGEHRHQCLCETVGCPQPSGSTQDHQLFF